MPSSEAPSSETPPAETPPETPAETPAPEAVPLTLDDLKIDLPEGVALDEGVLTEFQGLANSLKLNSEQAQTLMKLHVSQVEQVMKAFTEGAQTTWNETQTAWRNEILADPEIGGAKAKETQTLLGRALDEFGSPEARQALNLTGAGNSLPLVKMFAKMAKQLVGEGTPVPAGQGRNNPKGGSIAERLYGAS